MAGIRGFWLLLGLIATACGMAGVVLPLVPTTPFLLLAAYAFARGSPRLHAWLLGHPRLGPLIENWQRHGCIDPRTKIISVIVMGGTFLMSWIIGAGSTVLTIQAAVLAGAATFVLTRPGGPPQ